MDTILAIRRSGLVVAALLHGVVAWPMQGRAQVVDTTLAGQPRVMMSRADSARANGYVRYPVAAMGLAYVVPGAGHLYAGEPGRAVALLTTAAVTLTAWTVVLRHAFENGDCTFPSGTGEPGCPHVSRSTGSTVAVGVVIVGAVGLLAGLVDAPFAVVRQRKRHANAYAARTQSMSIPNRRDTSASYAASCPSTSVVLQCSSAARSGAIRFAAPRP